MFKVKEKVIVITGGGGVLGGYLAKEFGKLGAKVAVLDIDEQAARAVVEEIKKNGGEAQPVKCNVLEKDSIVSAYNRVREKYQRVDILLNAAGGNNPKATTDDEQFGEQEKEDIKTFFDIEKEDLKLVLDLNLIGTMLVSQVFAKEIKSGGVIINFSSMNAFRPLTKISAYSAAKAAVSNFTQWLAVYLAKQNIRVNAIAPGFFLTKQNEFLLKNKDGSLTERGKKIIDHTPMGCFGEPKDLLGTVLWLISDASKFITGIVVPIDGGFSAYSGV